MRRIATRVFLFAALPLSSLMAACGGSSGGSTPPEGPVITPPPVSDLPAEVAPDGPVDTVRERLTQLGFDPADEEGQARRLSESVTAPTEYAPLGYRARVAPTELFGAGIGSSCTDPLSGESDASRVLSLPLRENDVRSAITECYAYEEGDLELAHAAVPDASYGKPGAQSTRAIAAGDFDGDDLQEGALLLARPGADGAWELHGYLTDRGSPFSLDDTWLPGPIPLGDVNVVDVEALATDVDGNGLDDLVVGVVTDGLTGADSRRLRVFVSLQSRAGDMAAAENAFDHSVPAAEDLLSVRLAAGNFAEGFSSEVAVLLRSIRANGSHMPEAGVDYWVLGQTGAGALSLEVLHAGDLNFTHADGETQPFLTADAVFGDFDGDGFEELAFTGILAFPEDDFCRPYRFGYQIIDDQLFSNGAWSELASLAEMVSVGDCDRNPGLVYEVFANALDYDGGVVRELLANDRIFRYGPADPAETAGEKGLHLVHSLGREVYAALADSGHFAEATSSIAVGDFDNDGLGEVAFYSITGDLEIRGQGDFAKDGEWLIRFDNPPADSDVYPELLGYDNDEDGIVVEFIPGSHEVVLTEPIILAVLIAPPYDPALGQDPADATTSHGTSVSDGQSFEGTVTVTSGVVLGKNVGGSIGPIEISAGYSNTLTRYLETAQGSGYETTFTTSYTTAGKDAVQFTSFPYDSYDYRIVAAYEPWLVDTVYTVLMPRKPLERLVSIKYFDDRVPEGGLQLGALFEHTNGDPWSYMSRSEMLDLRDRVSAGLYGMDTFLATPRTVTPPQGSNNSVELGIEVSKEDFSTETSGTSMDHTVELTVPGNSVELTTGDGESSSVTLTTGSSMAVSSSIPGVDVDERGTLYSAGMFTYVHRAGSGEAAQNFQVINFWVE